jgi:hypothetical protein
MRYRPASVAIGAGISALALAVAMAVFAGGRRARVVT